MSATTVSPLTDYQAITHFPIEPAMTPTRYIRTLDPEDMYRYLFVMVSCYDDVRRFIERRMEEQNIIAVSTQTDPYILEQAYDADEAALMESGRCVECGSLEPCDCFEEPEEAGLVTGYDNGPTYW